MAASPVTVSNMALTRLGGSTIASLTEGSKESILCNTFFEASRDAVLREHLWGFARKRKTLAEVDSSLPDNGWSYIYAYPSDCLAARHIYTPIPDGDAIPYERCIDSSGTQLILTDQPEAVLVYTARVTDLTRCDPIFIEALSWKLAAEVAIPLTQNSSLTQMAFKEYQSVLSRARTADANEGQARKEGLADWLKVRGVQ